MFIPPKCQGVFETFLFYGCFAMFFLFAIDFLSEFVYNVLALKNMESCPSWSKEHDWKSCM